MLLYYVGEEICDVFEIFIVLELLEGSDEYKIVVKVFVDYFEF